MGADDPIPDAPPATGHATADSDHSAADQGQPVEQQPTDDYLATVDRLSFASWGDGSHPSLPSIAGSETTFDDGDSAVGSFRSSTMSLRSSIYDYVEENGRTYHRYKQGKYPLPNDQMEQDRLDLQHALFLLTSHGKLFLAPLDDHVRHVLDIATGTGIWAVEFAQVFPGATVLGTDLSPIQPLYVPPNCRFEVDDAEDEWTFSTQFNYIHGRALLTCFKSPPQVIQSAYKSLAPGGWLELQDFYFPMEYIDGLERTDTALYKWNQLCMEGGLKAGRAWTHAQHYKRYLEEAGFEEVVERRFYWPLGSWAKGKYYQTLGEFMREVLFNGLDAISFKVIGSLGWTVDEIRVFLAQVRNDIRDPSIHAYMNIIFVYGRKPLQA